MRRILKDETGTIIGRNLVGEGFKVKCTDENSFSDELYDYILEYRETDRCYFYNLTRTLKEGLEGFLVYKSEVKQMPTEMFYKRDFSLAILFENDDEEGIGYVIGERLLIPVKEDEENIHYHFVHMDIMRKFFTLEEREITGKLCYNSMKDSDVNWRNEFVTIYTSKNTSILLRTYSLYKIAERAVTQGKEMYFMREEGKYYVVRGYKIKNYTFYTLDKTEELPVGAMIYRERYISKKKTVGITNFLDEPFGFLNY